MEYEVLLLCLAALGHPSPGSLWPSDRVRSAEQSIEGGLGRIRHMDVAGPPEMRRERKKCRAGLAPCCRGVAGSVSTWTQRP